jgi:predicted DNA-binding mobile mystery protein A
MVHATKAAVGDFLAMPAAAQTSGYSGEQSREIKALSAEETADLLAGRGMGAARAARALDCTLVYALVPNGSLDGLVREQARKVAAETVSRVDHSMKLEGQGVPAGTLEEERERLAEELLRRPRRLWDQL